jgi:L-aspartate oxidase
MMGGIVTDVDARASLSGLYAVGECSCTGLHGANRLASNSLTECFVFGARAAHAALAEPMPSPNTELDRKPRSSDPPKLSPQSRERLWRYAGLERDGEGLRQLERDPYPLVPLIAGCALARTESRGAHQRRDFPDLDPGFDDSHTTVDASGAPSVERWS